MTEPATLSVRILSGLHAGARMTLADGDWIAGRDDSCDIILADGGIAPRHVCLTVKGGVLKAAALDGEVTENAYIPRDLIGPVAEVIRWVQSLKNPAG